MGNCFKTVNMKTALTLLKRKSLRNDVEKDELFKISNFSLSRDDYNSISKLFFLKKYNSIKLSNITYELSREKTNSMASA